jgi:DNA-3-methyladenine glycosylase
MALRKLHRAFYLRPTRTVARELLGKYLIRRLGRDLLVGKIVEVEAYLHRGDPASHAYRGRTRRNEVMFRNGGRLYVYFTYGMHFCGNVVTEEASKGCAVLLRAVEPVRGLAAMAKGRGLGRIDQLNLCSGPAKLCQAFGIGATENGTDLCGRLIWIAGATGQALEPEIARSSRIGITRGREHRWRYFVKNNPFVSRSGPGRVAGNRPTSLSSANQK